MRRSIARAVPAFLIALALGVVWGCGSEDRLTGTPKNLPPNTMPPAPPLTQSPADLAKARKVGVKHGSAKPAIPAR